MVPGGAPTPALLAMDDAWVNASDEDPLIARVTGRDAGTNPAADLLKTMVRVFPEESEFILTDRFGATVAATGRLTDFYQGDERWWQAAWNHGQGAVYMSQPSFDQSANAFAIDVATLVRAGGDGEPIGVLRSTFAVDKLFSIVRQIRAGTSGWAAIVDRYGRELGSAAGLFGWTSSVPSNVRPVLASAMNDPAGATAATADVMGQNAVLGRSQIEMVTTGPEVDRFERDVSEAIGALEWTAIVGRSETEVDVGLIAAMKRSLVIGVAAVILASLMAVVVATLMTRRIGALKAAARAIGAGALDTAIPHLGSDDIGVLARAFGQMANRLRETIQSLQLQADDTSLANEQLRQENDLRKQAERALREAMVKAESASRAKSRFLANMSHELRTPLNAVIGFADILGNEMMGPLGSPRYKEYAEDIRASGSHLLQLINDILDLSKIEAGKLDLHEEWLVLGEVIESARAMVAEKAVRQGLLLRVDVPAALPRLLADRRLTLQVLLNLLSNAVKFTPTGGRISIDAFRADDLGLAVRVGDTGIGIAEADIPIVLQPFGQVEGAFQRSHDGTGLGLPLSLSIMQLHGGRMDIASRPGEGTKVTIHFPASRVGDGLAMSNAIVAASAS
jgi:signal transduction histidine kinase